jgi:hypothetical protein
VEEPAVTRLLLAAVSALLSAAALAVAWRLFCRYSDRQVDETRAEFLRGDWS